MIVPFSNKLWSLSLHNLSFRFVWNCVPVLYGKLCPRFQAAENARPGPWLEERLQAGDAQTDLQVQPANRGAAGVLHQRGGPKHCAGAGLIIIIICLPFVNQWQGLFP